MARRGLWTLGGLAILGFAAAGVVWATWPDSPLPTDWSHEYDTAAKPPSAPVSAASPADFPVTFDLVTRPAESLPPGLIVESKPPVGWSHLVIKSLPRIREEYKKDLPALAVEKASWMFTAFLADVKKETVGGQSRYRFNKLGLGLGASALGRDTILTPETARKLGAGFDPLKINQEILTKGYEVQNKAVVVFSGPSMAMLDTPVWFRCGEENHLVRYRYALLVEGASGRLDVLLWQLGGDGCGNLESAVWLKPNTVDVAELVVDAKRVHLGLPGADAFAVAKMPLGRPVEIPAGLRSLAAQTRFNTADAHRLDSELRKLLK